MAHEDWDLFAIVRSCQAATFTATTTTETPPTTTTSSITRSPQDTTTSCLATFVANQENGPFSFPNLVQPRPNGFQELNQLFMTFNPTTTTTTSTSGNSINPNSPFSDFAGSIGQQQRHHHPVLAPSSSYTSIGASTSGFDRFHHHQQQHVQQPQPPEEEEQQQQHNQLHVQVPQTYSMVLPNTQSQTPRSRKRKSQQKKIVCHVTADNLSSDLWAWRKYGQKPIKGSPYPRNYYRCSSCKGCAARKQVERSTTEPTMFIVTYTGEHKHAKPSHRNSLAGSTRNKPSTTRLPANRETRSPSSVSNANSSSIAVVSPTQQVTSPLVNDDEDPVSAGESEEADREPKPDMGSDEDDVLIPNSMAMSEPVFLGLHHFDGVCSKTADNSDPNSVPGLAPPCFEPASNNNRPNPG